MSLLQKSDIRQLDIHKQTSDAPPLLSNAISNELQGTHLIHKIYENRGITPKKLPASMHIRISLFKNKILNSIESNAKEIS